jgi:hypothetical protein
MSETIFKHNRKILLRLFKKHIPVFTEDMLFSFLAEIRNMRVLYRKILSEEQLEHIFLYNIIPKIGE